MTPNLLLARRKRIEEDKELGTRIVLAGIVDGRGPFQGPTKVLVSTEAEARAAVDNYKRLGFVQIKIYSSVKPELVPAIIDEAHKNGLPVSGHIPAEMTAAQCVELGYDEIHVTFLILNFMPEIKNTNTIARPIEPTRRGADLDLSSPQVQSFIKLFRTTTPSSILPRASSKTSTSIGLVNSSWFPTHSKPLAYAGPPRPALHWPDTARRTGPNVPEVVREDDGTDWPALSLRNFNRRRHGLHGWIRPASRTRARCAWPAYLQTKFCRMPRLTPPAL